MSLCVPYHEAVKEIGLMKETKDIVIVDDVFTLEEMAAALEEDLEESGIRDTILAMIFAGLAFIGMMLVM